MHTDENKQFDKRNIERNIKDGLITREAYEGYLAKLADASDKVFIPEEIPSDSEEFESTPETETQTKRKVVKKKIKPKGK